MRILVLAAQYNIDPIHLGVVVVLTIMIGSLTPPVGLVLYTVMATTNIRMITLVKALWPFYLVLLIATLLVALVPSISLWLPTTALNN
jgi:TRAP-type C4-dicarboxylate transport system permease large subunit